MNVLQRGLAPLACALLLGGCTSMSGLGGDASYACKAPEGVACESVSGTYANAVANNLPSQRKRQSAQDAPTADALAPRATAPARVGLPAADGLPTLAPESSLRAQARTLRLWIKPWEDIDGDLYDQAHIYVQIDHGRWLIDHVRQRIRDTHAPLRAPPSAAARTGPDAETGPPESRTEPPRPPASALFPPPARPPKHPDEVPQ